MHLLLICDPPVVEEGYNTGVAQVIRQIIRHLPEGHKVTVLTRQNIPAVAPGESVYDEVVEQLNAIDFDHIHIITEGRLALLTRVYCNARGLRYTSACHAQYDMFCQARHGEEPPGLKDYIRWFHASSARVLAPSQSFAQLLQSRGIKAEACPNGVDVDFFRPMPDESLRARYEAPIWLYVGRLDPEKSIHEFLSLDLPGTKLVVGDGSIRNELQEQFPQAHFVGLKLGEELVSFYSSADVKVFPSRSDTFGLVLPEALACGLPIAAYPDAIGPSEIISSPKVGCLNYDLRSACLGALELSPDDCRQHALLYAWPERVQHFLSLQVHAYSRSKPVSVGFERRYWAKYGAQLRDLENRVVDVENWLFGGKACFLKPDEEEIIAA
jgi:glycosyltransferase involved in cell wall biosynthesis